MAGVAESQDSAEMPRRESALFQTPASELARTQVGVAGHIIEIDVATRRRDEFDGALHGVESLAGYPAELGHKGLRDIGAGLRIGQAGFEFTAQASGQIFETNGQVR